MELHTIDPDLTFKNQGETLACSYDCTHGFSDQYLVEYDIFIKCAKVANEHHKLAKWAKSWKYAEIAKKCGNMQKVLKLAKKCGNLQKVRNLRFGPQFHWNKLMIHCVSWK